MKELIFPNVAPKSGRAVIVPSAIATRNKYSGTTNVYDNGTDFWRLRYQLDFCKGDEAFELDNLLTELRGPVNGVWLKDWNYQARGDWDGNFVVDGDDQEGTQLSLRGGAISKLVAKVGDRFQLGKRMHRLTSDATTNETGLLVVNFEPQLAIIPSDGQAIITDTPKALYRWVNTDNRPQFDKHRRIFRGVDLVFEEV